MPQAAFLEPHFASNPSSRCGHGMIQQPFCPGSGNWSQALIRMQQSVTDAGAEIDATMRIVLASALELMPQADGAIIEMRDGSELFYRAASGTAAD